MAPYPVQTNGLVETLETPIKTTRSSSKGYGQRWISLALKPPTISQSNLNFVDNPLHLILLHRPHPSPALHRILLPTAHTERPSESPPPPQPGLRPFFAPPALRRSSAPSPQAHPGAPCSSLLHAAAHSRQGRPTARFAAPPPFVAGEGAGTDQRGVLTALCE